jgi:hypothetical protein
LEECFSFLLCLLALLPSNYISCIFNSPSLPLCLSLPSPRIELRARRLCHCMGH